MSQEQLNGSGKAAAQCIVLYSEQSVVSSTAVWRQAVGTAIPIEVYLSLQFIAAIFCWAM
jgi:hypothetical protein